MKRSESLAWAPLVTVTRVNDARRELGLGPTATRREIHARHIVLARRWHPDKNQGPGAEESQERFRRISQAYAFLQTYMVRYRYDLRHEAVRRDQEPPDIQHSRRFGEGLYPTDAATAPSLTDDPLKGPLRLTAENIEWARRKLGLLERIRADDLDKCFRRAIRRLILPRTGRDEAEAERERIALFRAADLIRQLLRDYRYSFRPEDVRQVQEDWLQRHRRQFGNDPVWAGGTYHDNPDWTPYPNLDFDGGNGGDEEKPRPSPEAPPGGGNDTSEESDG